tara:strand:- start:12419 stop:12715 length:297 start_codon:yes stop_codon:yes gene_type:complete
MSIKVKLSTQKTPIKTTVASGTIMARTLGELLDVNIDNVNDKYLLMYDGTTQKYVAVNPDDVLINAVEEPISPGLPDQLKAELSSDLDNKIDLDGGIW